MYKKKKALQEEMISYDIDEYESFRHLSVEVLEGMVRDFTLSGCDSDEASLARIMRVLSEKQPFPSGLESEDAWQAFCQSYDVLDFMIPPEQISCPSSPSRAQRRFFPHLPRAVAVILVVFATTVFSLGVAQAAGWIDVIGFIFGRGHVTVSDPSRLPADTGIGTAGGLPDSVDSESDAESVAEQLAMALADPRIQEALDELGVHPHLPTWFPEGFVCQNVVLTPADVASAKIKVRFSRDVKLIQLVIQESTLVVSMETEEDEVLEEYTSHGVTYYLMDNLQQARVLWKEGPVLIRISGDLTTEQLKKMIDSIGGTE